VKVATIFDGIAAAKRGGFEGLEVQIAQLANLIDERGTSYVKGMFADAGIKPAAFGLPTDWRNTDQKWRSDLPHLSRFAKAAASIGIRRTFTWIMPCSNDRPMEENRKFHIERFKPIARTLGEYNVHLGLEFIGPKTLRENQKYPFIYKMSDMLEMGREIGPNVGILLDCWHWYTSGGTIAELEKLRPEQVVYVHVNDAPAGVAVDQQIDNVRDLPGATGVIDISGFLKALKQIGYDGPVTPEPFKKELGDLASDEARLKTVGAAMEKTFRAAGV
jgi:sugar phosphate isomerase/epimerase